MDHPARLLIDCPRCERCGVLALNDDRTIACPLCNNWCSLCLDSVPTFVPITLPYRSSLIASMRPTIDGERLFEGYACDYHKAALRSYSSIAPPMVGPMRLVRHTSRHRGASLSCATRMGRRLMMRRSPSVSGPTRHYELSGHAPSGTMAAFDAWRECAGTALARSVLLAL